MNDDDRPLGATFDLEAWEPEKPPADFAERVLARVRAPEREARGRTRRLGIGAAAAVALALAAAIALKVKAPPAKGEAHAQERIEVNVGGRAKAVLEPGAQLGWNGDDVTQRQGDVFYRVEPGARFRVHTPAGDVEVKGTCFTVKVRGDQMDKRDMKSASVGGTLTALAFVIVYEGKVAVSHAESRVELVAGESAQLGPGGAEKSRDVASGEKRFLEADPADPLASANQNLITQVSEYRRRLESIAAQKSELEKKLDSAEKKLAGNAGGPTRTRSEYDLDQEDWRDLAKKGEVKYQMPCLRADRWNFGPEKLQSLGLAPQDGGVLKEAYEKSYQRTWQTVRPLCAAALGTTDQVVDKIGPDTCAHLVYDQALTENREAAQEAHTQVAEIRAGLRPEPASGDKTHPVLKLFLLLTNANRAFEADLAKNLGPEEAHRLAYAEGMCMSSSRWGGGKPRAPAEDPK